MNEKFFDVIYSKKAKRYFLVAKDLTTSNIEDFLLLDEIFNKDKRLGDWAKFSLKNKNKIKALTLAFLTSFNIIASSLNIVLDKDNEVNTYLEDNLENLESHLTYLKNKYVNKVIKIKDLKELDEILGYKSVTKEEVMTAIQNLDLPLKYKIAAQMVLDEVTSYYPKIDLRIFYENIKNFTVEELSREELEEQQGNVSAVFSFGNHKIITFPEAGIAILKHEFYHFFNCFTVEKEAKKYIYTTDFGYSLMEAMTEDQVSQDNEGSYLEERSILHYLNQYVSFSMEAYWNYGIIYLIELLEKKYPNVDFETVVAALDDRKEKRKKNLELEEEPKEIFDELFKVCLRNALDTFDYQSFSQFSKMITPYCSEDHYWKYFREYNSFLEIFKCSNLISKLEIKNKLSVYEQVKSFLILKEQDLIPIISYYVEDNILKYKTLDENDKIIERELDANTFYRVANIPYNISYLDYILKYPKASGKNFFNLLNRDLELVSNLDYKKIEFLVGDLIIYDYVDSYKIQVTQNEAGELGFILLKDDEVIYAKGNNYKYKTNSIILRQYLECLNNKERLLSLNLEDVFNENYLKMFLKQRNNNWYGNFVNNPMVLENICFDQNEKIVVKPRYMIGFEEPYRAKYYVGNCFFMPRFDKDGNKVSTTLKLGLFWQIDLDIVCNFEKIISLEEVLNYYSLLKENNLEYFFTKEEIKELIKDYIKNFDNEKILHI